MNKIILLVIETIEGPSEEGDKISDSIRTGEFIDKLRSLCMSKKDCVPKLWLVFN
jgi:hypothetical protein